MPELLANFSPALVWNQPGSPPFWFHYTARASARAIVASRTFEVGTRHASGRAGLYVCPHQPGALTEDELAAKILDGSYYDREKLQAAVVLAAGPDVSFVSDPGTRAGMRFLAAPGTLVELSNQIVGWAAVENGEWLHSPTLFEPAALAELRSAR